MEETETKFDRWVSRIYFGIMLASPIIMLIYIFINTR